MSDFFISLNILAEEVHRQSSMAGWWDTPESSNIPTKLLLIHSEISEAAEGFRSNLQDTHLPHRKMIEVELADALIRILDLAVKLEFDSGSAVKEKLAYNQLREDHKITVRNAGGKRF